MGLASPLSMVASCVRVVGGEGWSSGGVRRFGGETGTGEVRRVGCRRPSWALMEVVKGYDAKAMMRTIPCEMDHQSFGVDSNGAERRPRDGHGRPGGRKTG